VDELNKKEEEEEEEGELKKFEGEEGSLEQKSDDELG
jgi:hypothetical protein